MKIALIQTNPIIGDFRHNIENMSQRLRHAKASGCDLAIFPELSISGYPPQDFLERPSFIADQEKALRDFSATIDGIAVICGAFTRNTAGTGKPLRNTAMFMGGGAILFKVHKHLLPSYDVFDETRYFEPGSEGGESFTFMNERLGLTICEDIWNDPDVFPHRPYQHDPVAHFFSSPAPPRIIVNIAASPFHLDKFKIKETLFRNLCKKYSTALLYVNQVGGQDSLIFDGMSLAMAANGAIMGVARKFEEDCLIIDSSTLCASGATGKDHESLCNDQLTDAFDALVLGVRDYARKCGFTKALLGLSGGIDSALTAVIASRALGAENVLGVALPSEYSSQASLDDARKLAANLGMDFKIIPITSTFQSMRETLAPMFRGYKEDVTEQNLQARIRGNLLMALSNKFGALLLSTGNKSEMAVGYCTLYGDMSGGLAVISDLPKMLVYKLARHSNRENEVIPERTITRAPTAELAPNQKDDDDLPPYAILDPIISAYLEDHKSPEEIMAMGFDPQTTIDVVRRIKQNEYKRKQAPMGLKLTTKAFGIGRRYPNAENYNELIFPEAV